MLESMAWRLPMYYFLSLFKFSECFFRLTEDESLKLMHDVAALIKAATGNYNKV